MKQQCRLLSLLSKCVPFIDLSGDCLNLWLFFLFRRLVLVLTHQSAPDHCWCNFVTADGDVNSFSQNELKNMCDCRMNTTETVLRVLKKQMNSEFNVSSCFLWAYMWWIMRSCENLGCYSCTRHINLMLCFHFRIYYFLVLNMVKGHSWAWSLYTWQN